jgi:putative PIN family toxin of toxin-antitoxin system
VIPVVFDTSVIVSAIGWRGPAHRCLALVARHSCRLVVTAEILAEYEERVPEVLAAEAPHTNVIGPLGWIRDKAWMVEAVSLGKRRSRDVKDDRFLAAALAVSAQALVSYDEDLLVLEKPFGIPILRPPRFLEWFAQEHG